MNSKLSQQILYHAPSRSYLGLEGSGNNSQFDDGNEMINDEKNDLKLKPRSKQLEGLLEITNGKTKNQSTLSSYKANASFSDKTNQNSLMDPAELSSTNNLRPSNPSPLKNLRTKKLTEYRPISPNITSTKSPAVLSRKESNVSISKHASESEENGKNESELTENTALTNSVPKLRTKQISLIYPDTGAASNHFPTRNTIVPPSLNSSFANSPFVDKYSLQNSKIYGKSTVNLAPINNSQGMAGQPAGNISEAYPAKFDSKHRRFFTLAGGGNANFKGIFEPIQNQNTLNAIVLEKSLANGNSSLNTPGYGLDKELLVPNNVKKLHTINLNASIEKTPPLINGKTNSDDQHELKIESLLSKKRSDPSHLKEVNDVFESVIANTNVTTTHKEIQKHQSVLKRIKFAYESFFQNYIESVKARREKDISEKEKSLEEKEELELENRQLKVQLKALNEEMQLIKDSNFRQQGKQNDLLSPQILRTSYSPTPSELLSTNKKNPSDYNDTPPATINPAHVDRERAALQSIIQTQQNTISSLKKKEAKLVRLLYACKQQGLDLEKLYIDDVKGSFDRSDSQESDLPTLNKNTHLAKSGLKISNHLYSKSDHLETEGEAHTLEMHHTSVSIVESASDRGLKDQSADQHLYNQEDSNPKQHLSLPIELKDKLKLDFTSLQTASMTKSSQLKQTQSQAQLQKQPKISKLSVPTLKINGIQLGEHEVGFHEEFMSKIDEFSESWRLAAQNERKIP